MSYRHKNMRLGDACTIQSGYTARSGLIEDEIAGAPAIQLRDLREDEGISLDRLVKYRLEGNLERYAVHPGDVLFRSRGENNTASMAVGKTGDVATALLPVMVIRPNGPTLDPEFVAWSINQPEAQRYLDSCARGTKLRMIPRDCLEDMPISIPSIKVQRLIVELDRLSLRESALLRELAEKKREFTRFALLRQVRNAQLHGHEAGHHVARKPSPATGKSQRTNS